MGEREGTTSGREDDCHTGMRYEVGSGSGESKGKSRRAGRPHPELGGERFLPVSSYNETGAFGITKGQNQALIKLLICRFISNPFEIWPVIELVLPLDRTTVRTQSL